VVETPQIKGIAQIPLPRHGQRRVHVDPSRALAERLGAGELDAL
jgi:hypothetical protein